MHFSSFLKGFQMPKIDSDFRVRLLDAFTHKVTWPFGHVAFKNHVSN